MTAANYFLPAFVRDIDSTYVVGDLKSFWSCERFLLRFAAEGGIPAAVNDQVSRLGGDEQFIGDWGPREVGLFCSRNWSLSLAVLDSTPRFIHALSELALFVPLQGKALRAHKYSLPDSFRNDVFDPAIQLKPAGTVGVRDAEAFALESDRYAYDFEITEPVTVIRLMTKPLRPLEWLFSKSTLRAWQANDADIASTQLRVAAYVLGKIAHQSSVAPLKCLSTHPHHAVRWAAIQNLGRLNRSEALVKIREAINDPHPHVRRAAQRTLEQIEKPKSPLS